MIKNGKDTKIDPYCEFLGVSGLVYSANETITSFCIMILKTAKHYSGGHFGDLKVKNGGNTKIDTYCEFLRVSDLVYSGNETLLSSRRIILQKKVKNGYNIKFDTYH